MVKNMTPLSLLIKEMQHWRMTYPRKKAPWSRSKKKEDLIPNGLTVNISGRV